MPVAGDDDGSGKKTGIVMSVRVLAPSGWGRIVVDTSPYPVMGGAVGICPGDSIEWEGVEERNRFGVQTKAIYVRKVVPHTYKGQEVWAQNLPGVGRTIARALVKVAEGRGCDLWEVLSGPAPEIRGLNAKKWGILVEKYGEMKGTAVQASALMEIGVKGKLLDRAVKKWGDLALATIQENPYLLIGLDGVAWIKADEIAKQIPVALDCPFRIVAGIGEAVRLVEENGSTWSPTGLIVYKAARLLDLDKEMVKAQLRSAEEARYMVLRGDNGCMSIFPGPANAERCIGNWVKEAMDGVLIGNDGEDSDNE